MAPPASSKTGIESATQPSAAGRIFGAGEMADRIRAFDWAATPMGPIACWPDTLLNCVNLLLGSRHPMFLWWGPDLIQFYNDAYRPSLGIGKHPTALGQPGQQCWPEVWDHVQQRIDSVMRDGKATWYENQLVPILRNGRIEDVYWTWSDSPVRDAAGNVAGVFVACTETTDRVLADREAKRSHERLQLALEAAGLGTWSYNPADDTFTADDTMLRIFGASEPTGGHDYWQQTLHPDDRRAAREEFDAALAGVRPYHLEYRVLHPEGIRWVRSKGKVVEADGHSKGMFAVVEEITESKLAEIEMEQRARELREAQRIGKMGSWRWKLASNDLSWSDEVYRLTEHDPTQPVLNFTLNPEIMDPESNVKLQAVINECIATGKPYEIDTKMVLPGTGRNVWFATRGEAVYGTEPGTETTVVELRGTVRDITDRKLAEDALRSSEERLHLALEAASLGTWTYDASTNLSTGDETMQRIFGSAQAAGDFDYWIEFSHPEDRAAIEADFRAAIETDAPYETEYRIIRPTDGETRWIRSRGRILREPSQPLRMIVIVEDTTDRKNAEAALLRTEKLAAVGRLASSIAHEINNPLEAVTNLVYLAKSNAKDPNLVDYLTTAEQELHRAAAITSQTLRFHKQSTSPIAVTWDDLVGNALAVLRSRLANAKVNVEQHNRATRPVMCFDGEIRQVLCNLLINAADAMQAGGGRILLRGRDGRDHSAGREGLVITVADTGTGMAPATTAKIFEPFYTTKGAVGTGLGLWISKEIVERHKGRLRVRSSQRARIKGTVFTVFLPFDAVQR